MTPANQVTPTDEELLQLYQQAYPDAQDPERYIANFGLSGLASIILKGEGKRIRFRYKNPLESEEVIYEYY